MNKCIFIGRLVKDPEVRYTQNGKCNASFTLATARFVGSKETDFIPIIAWEKKAEICGNNLVKGSQVMVEGRYQTRSYISSTDGIKKYITEIVLNEFEFLGSKPKNNILEGAEDMGEVVEDEEIPF